MRDGVPRIEVNAVTIIELNIAGYHLTPIVFGERKAGRLHGRRARLGRTRRARCEPRPQAA